MLSYNGLGVYLAIDYSPSVVYTLVIVYHCTHVLTITVRLSIAVGLRYAYLSIYAILTRIVNNSIFYEITYSI